MQIVHFGIGNFARAHIAAHTDSLEDWHILGVSLRSSTVRDGLKAQGFQYRLAVQGQAPRIIDTVRNVLVAPEDPDAVLASLREPETQVISATVTEKGYHLNADGSLNLTAPDIEHDLQSAVPRSIIGYLAYGLAKRDDPVTVLCCDNRLENGLTLENAVKTFAEAAGLRLPWSTLSFPNTMVDRITPATQEADRMRYQDPMVVCCEPFSEWVIEDRFAGAKPNWPGVQWVSEVAPHEMRKLRLLNGAHSYLAYAGILAGHSYVHEAIGDPILRQGARDLMAEASLTLPQSVQDQADSYAKSLIERFENPLLRHALIQIAMDGSQKIPYRWGDSLKALQDMRAPRPALSAAFEAWCAFCKSEIEAEQPLNDPLNDEISKALSREVPRDALAALVNVEPDWLV
ncbi:MAG: mannitol dehydrogenase family protein [Pseudomonadota bacterium]